MVKYTGYCRKADKYLLVTVNRLVTIYKLL